MNQPFDTLQKFGTHTAEAALQTVGALSTGAQAIAVESADYARRSFEQGTATLERLVGARTLDRALEIQSASVRAAYEDFLAQSAKMGRLYAGLAGDALKPYEGLVNATTKPASAQ